MLNLSLEEIKKILKKYKNRKDKIFLIPVYKEIFVDTETPVSLFLKLAKEEKFSYLLESAQTNLHWGRYSFISFSPKKVLKIEKNSKDILTKLRKEVNNYFVPTESYRSLPRFFGGLVGYLNYELVHILEPKVPLAKNNFLIQFPETFFMFNSITIIFDHFLNRLKFVSFVEIKNFSEIEKEYFEIEKKIDLLITKIYFEKPEIKNLKFKYGNEKDLVKKYVSNMSKNGFVSKVKKTVKYIKEGDIIQAVISRKLAKKTSAEPFDIYRGLRLINPSPYMFFLKFDDTYLIGSSPEILVRKEGEIIETRPIAGTRPRSVDEEKDKLYEKELITSQKENAEHIMLVDLARNDIGKISKFGTVTLPQLKVVERFSHVMHIVSSVKGVLKKGYDCIDVLSATFPAGTVSGAPKVRAMEIISELENYSRGPYAGAVGYFGLTGNMDFAITIRTILYKDNWVMIQSGAGIVADSIPEKEFFETINKAKALMLAIEIAEN
jgi:anthranilate synthase component 1